MKYISPNGEIDIEAKVFRSPLGGMDIPIDVWVRGHRLFRLGLFECPFAYIAKWCGYRQEGRFTSGDNTNNEHP